MTATITQPSLAGLHLPAVSYCGICHRQLTNPASIAAGIGPVCRGKHRHEEHDQMYGDQYDLPFDPETMDIVCRRDPDGTKHFNLRPGNAHHSPDGFEWGYPGSGPADFALNIVRLFVNQDPPPVRGPEDRVTLWDGSVVHRLVWDLHQEFKRAFIATLPREGGVIRGDAIRAWLAAQLEVRS